MMGQVMYGGGGGRAWGVGKRQEIKLGGGNQLFKKHIVMPGSFMVGRMWCGMITELSFKHFGP